MSSIIEIIDELEESIVDCKKAYDQFCDKDNDNISLWGTYSAIELVLPDIKYSIQDLYIYFVDFNENDSNNSYNISTLKSNTFSYTQYLLVLVSIKRKFPSIKTKEISKKIDIKPKVIKNISKKRNILNEEINIIEPPLLTGFKSSGNTGSFLPSLPKHSNKNYNNNIKILRLSSENINESNNNESNNNNINNNINDNNEINSQLNSIRRSRIRKFQNDANIIKSISKLCDNKVINKSELKNKREDKESFSYIPKFPSKFFCLSTSINFNNGSPFDWFRDIQIFETSNINYYYLLLFYLII
jgi:hypothetical protein